MIRLMPARFTPSSWDSRWTSRSRATSRGLYRRPPPGGRPGVTRARPADLRSGAGGPAGADEAEPVVLAQRLGVHAGELGGHGDDEDGRVLGDAAEGVLLGATRGGRHWSPPAWTAAVICGRGSSSISSASVSTTLRWAGVSRAGTATSRVTSRSPARPLPFTPRPRTRRVRPLAVPAGTLSDTLPSRVGTVSVVPSEASAKVTGTVRARSSPLRLNSGCSATWTTTNRSPGGPPRRPGAPLPGSRMRWPSLTPAGMRTVMVRVWVVMPLPPQVGHGSSTTWPVPRQLRHGSEKANAPRLRLVTPAPWQTGQVCGTVPGLAPLPLQVGHVPGLCIRSGTVTPSTASSHERVASVSTSCPRAGPDAAWLRDRADPGAPAAPPPNSPPSRSPRPPAPRAPAAPVPPAAPNRSPKSKV